MRMPGENHSQSPKETGVGWLVKFVVVVGVTGVLLMVLSAKSAESLVRDVLEELGIAFVVAAILAAGVDTFARMKSADELQRDVLAAVFRRLIPDQFFEQVRDHVLTAVKVRKQYRLKVKLIRELSDHPGDFECETFLTYELHNITGYSPKSLINHRLDHDLTGHDSTGKKLPRYIFATIDEKPLDLTQCVDQFLLTHEIKLPKGKQPLSVKIHAASIMRVPDTWNWNMSDLAEGATIEIEVAAPEATGVKFEVRALHPENQELKAKEHNGAGGKWEWEFKPALLTWQGFEVISSR
jgi:hypothetical protein